MTPADRPSAWSDPETAPASAAPEASMAETTEAAAAAEVLEAPNVDARAGAPPAETMEAAAEAEAPAVPAAGEASPPPPAGGAETAQTEGGVAIGGAAPAAAVRATAAEGATKPYKGPESYAPEDAEMFFGRERISQQLISTILSSEFTLLHAPSGAGKTSVLNARLIPELELRGWTAVRSVPNDDPGESVRVAAVDALTPPPGAEAAALRRALAELAPPGSDPSLGELRAAYRALPVRDPRRRRLISPVALDGASFRARWGGGRVTPYFCRLLRESVDLEGFRAQLAALAPRSPEGGAVEGGGMPPVGDETRAGALAALLESPEWAREYALVLSALSVPVPGLLPFFENFTEVWGARHPDASVVLVLDQFEELFTRFVDTGPEKGAAAPGAPDWRLRASFFDDLRALYGGMRSGRARLFPMRVAISLREEFLARLAPLRAFVDEADLFSFGLGFLDREDAAVALGKPAEQYGYRYAPGCFEDILASLTREDRFVEPAKLQIVCEKLWNERGRELAAAAGPEDGPPDPSRLPAVEYEVYRKLGGVGGILGQFFRQYLDDLRDPADRFETLDLLAPLITASRTRNIVEMGQLVSARFRDPEIRRRLLEQLRVNSMVRIEHRYGGLFVEITHEFLIEPVLAAIAEERQRDERENRFRFALRALERAWDDSRPGPAFTAEELEALHRSRGRVRWEPWAVELMLRIAVQLGRPEHVAEWTRRYAEGAPVDPAAVWAEIGGGRGGRRLLTPDELRALDDDGEAAPSRDAEELILRSLIAHGRAGDRERIRAWTQRMTTHVT